MRALRTVSLLFNVFLLAACGRTESTPAAATPATSATAERKYLLENVDDAAVVQLYADAFAALPLREKTLAWHLYQAAIAGRDIYYDQKHRDALAMRHVLESIVTHSQGIESETLSAIQHYPKLFWIKHGPYNNLSARKFVIALPPEKFGDAARKAAQAGASFPTAPG